MEENNNVVQNDTIVNEPNNIVAEPVAQNNLNNNKGSKKGFIIIITLLVLIIAGLLVYMFVIKGDDKDKKSTDNTNNTNNTENNNNNNNNNDDNNNTNNTTNTESRNLTDKEQADLIEMIDTYGLDSLATKVDGKISGINNRLLLNSTYSKYLNQDIFTTTYNASDMSKYFKEAFNITVTNFTDIICPYDNEVMYKYDSSTNTYTSNEEHPGHGGEVVPKDDAHYIVKTNTNGEDYVVDIIFVYGSLLDGYYINGKELDLSLTGYTNDTPSEEVHDMVIKYFNNHKTEFTDGNIFEYTFKKNNDKFYLYSIKTVSNN